MCRVIAGVVALVLASSVPTAQTAIVQRPDGSLFQIEGGVTGGIVGGGPGPLQPPRDAQMATGRSLLRGRVIDAANGQPVRRATVRITAPELRGQRMTSTDADGRYEFGQLPAGRYSIFVTKAAYVNWSYGQTQPTSPGKPVVLADSQVGDNIDVRLPRGAVVTGHVFDEFGDPVPNASVAPMRLQFVQGQRRLAAASASVTTNDIGEYRLFGIAPGQYYISASLRTAGVSSYNGIPSRPEDRSGYSPTYYPGTADTSVAQKVTLGVAQVLNNINIALQPTRLAAVSGVAVDSEGQPIKSGAVMVVSRGVTGGAGVSGMIRNGIFTLENLTPGQYLLRANAPQTPPTLGNPVPPSRFSVAEVTVNGEDVTGVQLAPLPLVKVRGRIVFDDQSAAQSINPTAIRVIEQPADLNDVMTLGGQGSPPQALKDDFTFELQATPGKISLRPTTPPAQGTANPWLLKAVRLSGIDVTDRGIDIGGQDVGGIEIEMTNRVQRLTGQVTAGPGDPVTDYVVVIFAQDRARWLAPGNRYFAIARPADDKQFKISTLPAGEYYAIALDHYDLSAGQDPEFLESLRREATPIALSEGESRTLELRLFSVN